MTKTQKDKMVSWYKQWKLSTKTELYQAYGRCSEAKWQSWYAIKEQMKNNNGTQLRILGYNSDKYTCAYWWSDDKNNYFRVETSQNTYDITETELQDHMEGRN